MTPLERIIAKMAADLPGSLTRPMPPLLQVGLSGLGIAMKGWDRNSLLREHWLAFRSGTCSGVFGYSDDGSSLILMGVINDQPGNGDFGRLLEKLEKAAFPLELAVAVGPFMNDRLQDHLLAKRGFKMVGEMAVKIYDPAP